MIGYFGGKKSGFGLSFWGLHMGPCRDANTIEIDSPSLFPNNQGQESLNSIIESQKGSPRSLKQILVDDLPQRYCVGKPLYSELNTIPIRFEVKALNPKPLNPKTLNP